METIMTEWELHGMEFGNCNCAYACPCQFNALPTHGNCQAIGFFSVEKGHFGDAKLDGLNMAFAVSWPGAVHHGRGTMQPVIDKRANEAQRNALLSIMTGKETDPMTTFWAVYTAMCETIKRMSRPDTSALRWTNCRPPFFRASPARHVALIIY